MIERDVRTVQAIFLFMILAVISYYRIPIGKNLKGMISGYGLYIVTSLFTLAIRAYAGPRFNSSWNSHPTLFVRCLVDNLADRAVVVPTESCSRPGHSPGKGL